MHFIYTFNINIDIAIFCKYHIENISKLKTDIEASLLASHSHIPMPTVTRP